MNRRSPRLAFYLSALLFLGSCSSGTEPRLLRNPSPAALAGRYALTNPVSLANGSTILADTLVLGADRSLTRRQSIRGPGPIGEMMTSGLGTYAVNGWTIILAFNCLNDSCVGTQTLNAAARGRERQVTRLVLSEGGRTTVFDRAR